MSYCVGRVHQCFTIHVLFVALPPVGVQSIAVTVSVCMSVCLSARISQKSHVRASWNFLYMLPLAVTQSSFNDNAVHYVLTVLWMTSCFHIIGHMVVVIITKTETSWLPMWWLNIGASDNVMFGRVRQVVAPVGGCAQQICLLQGQCLPFSIAMLMIECQMWNSTDKVFRTLAVTSSCMRIVHWGIALCLLSRLGRRKIM